MFESMIEGVVVMLCFVLILATSNGDIDLGSKIMTELFLFGLAVALSIRVGFNMGKNGNYES